MANTFAVYSNKKMITPKQLVEAARKQGIELRFMGLGGVGFYNETRIMVNGKKFFMGPLETCLLIGAFPEDKEYIDQFDAAAAKNDDLSASALLHADRLPWCQLYSNGFHYGSKSDSYKKIIDSWSVADDHALIQSSTVQYLIENFCRKKACQRLVEQTTLILGEMSEGVITEFGSKPKKDAAKRPPLKKEILSSAPTKKAHVAKQPKSKKPSQAELKRNAKEVLVFATSKAWNELEQKLDSGGSFPLEERDMTESFSRCATSGPAHLLEKFIKIGMDVNLIQGGITPLERVARGMKLDIADVLLKNGADPNKFGTKYACTPLRIVAQCAGDICRAYFSKRIEKYYSGGDFTASFMETKIRDGEPNDDPRTPEFIEFANHLFVHSADPNIPDSEGFTPLDVLASAHYPDFVKLLFDSGMSVDSAQNEGKYALEQCIRYGDTETLTLLLANGADITAPLSTGLNALELAKKLERPEMLQVLKTPLKKANKHVQGNRFSPTPIPQVYCGIFRPDLEATLENKKIVEENISNEERSSGEGEKSKKDYTAHYQKHWDEYSNVEIEIAERQFIIRFADETRTFPAQCKEYGSTLKLIHVVANGLLEIHPREIKPGLFFFGYANRYNDVEYEKVFKVIWKKQ